MSRDDAFMRRAIELARLQHGRTGKNPSVGCVLVGTDGVILSEAATGDGGRPHAEQIALSALPDDAARGATAYVTLEPCHTRSTDEPSCSQRLVDAGIHRAAAVWTACSSTGSRSGPVSLPRSLARFTRNSSHCLNNFCICA